METTRDSSVWRSLAVAFGDGVAFGVGMKLTQNGGRPAAARDTGPAPWEGRLDEIEQRLDRMERLPPASAAPLAATPLDQKVLGAVVNALDARLNEHAAGVEKRLAELQARIAVELQALDRQDRATASGAQARVEQAQAEFNRQVAAAGERVARDLGALRSEIVSLQQEFAQAVARIVDERVQAQASAAGAVVEEKLAPLRAEMECKSRHIEELRNALSDRDRAVLEFMQAFGRICRDAAGRMSPPAAPADEEPAAAPEPEPPPQAEPAAAAPAAPAEDPVPGFAQLRSPGGAWRIPLVSSMLLATCGLLLHYWQHYW